MPILAFAYEPVGDLPFGTVGIALDHAAAGTLTVTVSGDGLLQVEIRRSAGTPAESHVPIGTRDRSGSS